MADQRWRVHGILGLCGAVVMALEILSSRVLAPAFGNSVYTWGSIISVVLAALSVGYAWGGKLADRDPRLSVLGLVIVLAGLCEVSIAVWGIAVAQRLSVLTAGSPLGALLAATVLFGPVSLLLAMTSPFAVRLAATTLSRLGETAGHLYAVSTAGSLIGTLGCTFVLVPFLELGQVFRVLIALTAVAGLAALVEASPAEAKWRWVAAALLLVAVIGERRQPAAGGELRITRVTPYQSLRITERSGVRLLTSDGVAQSSVRVADGEPDLLYPRLVAAVLLLGLPPDRFLGLGLGGGSAGTYLARRLEGMSIDYVEVDPAVEELARSHLLIRPPAEVVVHIDDARRFLATHEERWPFIYADTYVGLSIPFHLTTREYFTLVRERLEPDGVFGMNVAGGMGEELTKALVRTLGQVFENVVAFRAGGNLALFAMDGPLPTPQQMRTRGAELDARYDFAPTLQEISAQRFAPSVAADVEALTDGFAPVDRLLLAGDLPRRLLEQGRVVGTGVPDERSP